MIRRKSTYEEEIFQQTKFDVTLCLMNNMDDKEPDYHDVKISLPFEVGDKINISQYEVYEVYEVEKRYTFMGTPNALDLNDVEFPTEIHQEVETPWFTVKAIKIIG